MRRVNAAYIAKLREMGLPDAADICEAAMSTPDNNLLKAVKSLLSDIKTMSQEHEEIDYCFGPLPECEVDDFDVSIGWPNLAISAADVQKLIDEHEKVLVIDHQQVIQDIAKRYPTVLNKLRESELAVTKRGDSREDPSHPDHRG